MPDSAQLVANPGPSVTGQSDVGRFVASFFMTATEWKSELSRIPEVDRYAVEERAAIHEFDGRMDRDAAERLTLEDYWRKHGAWWFKG